MVDGKDFRLASTRWDESKATSHGPSGDVAASLDEAKAAFRAPWQRPLL